MLRKTNFKVLCVTILLLVLTYCATVPITGRSSLNLVPESDLNKLSLNQYQETLKKNRLSRNTAKTQMIKRVGQRIAAATEDFFRENGMQAEIKNYSWEFNLIDDDKTVNAWCMPGGKVAFYTGIIPVAQNETGIAVVMGHEIAHAVAKHGNERISQVLLVQLGGVGLSTAVKTQPAATKDIFMKTYGAGTSYGLLLPYSRLHESEADRIGLILMAKAGYDPRQAVPFWERMKKSAGKKSSSEFTSTHPLPQTRIQDIQSELPEALRYYKGK